MNSKTSRSKLGILILGAIASLGCGASKQSEVAGLDAGASPRLPSGTLATLGVLETTNLHSNIRSFDYFKLVEDKSLGLERTATLIREARMEFPSSLLVDNGDHSGHSAGGLPSTRRTSSLR
jgi:2',3'-cyclic-nucleotide 2'-phosphodiesterase / 3'-nucleotidase